MLIFNMNENDEYENYDKADEDETNEYNFEKTCINHTQGASKVVEFKSNDQKYHINELKNINAFEEVMHVWVDYNPKCAKKGILLQTFV